MENTDQQMLALINSYQIKQPLLKCDGNNLIKKMCTNPACKALSLHCDSSECEHCFQKHITCMNVSLDAVTHLLKIKYDYQRQLLIQMFEIENKLIKQLSMRRKEMVKQISMGSMQIKFAEMIEEIYFNNNPKTIHGKQGKQLFECISSLKKQTDIKTYLQNYESQAKMKFDQLNILKERIMKNYSGQIKIDSRIILESDKCYQQNIRFIFQSLQNPKRLELIYRASQNLFSASAFHNKCDKIANTLTIVRTQFGKTIAGYTPLAWNGSQGFMTDSFLKSFLLQIDLKQKMTLLQPNNAIFSNLNYGPVFGKGHDLCIYDKCEANNTSFANFPSSFNYNGQYVNNQKCHTLFCGSVNNYKFKVLQYEVYKVYWD